MRPLQGQVAIITGASRPRGMGRATALKLSEWGARIVVTDIILSPADRMNLEATARDIDESGVKALALPVDVTDLEQVEACVEQTIAQFGRIDILFNNAGVAAPAAGPFLEITPERWNHTWQVNVMGMVHFCHAVIPAMIQQSGGSIVNNASLAGLGAIAGLAAYTASKYAVIGLTKSIAAEFGSQGIRCNAICPGMVDTDMGRFEVEWFSNLNRISLEEAENLLIEPVVMGRWAQPAEVAEAVAFLASPSASYITGVALPVAGGLSPGL